jgi:hypothetical protein
MLVGLLWLKFFLSLRLNKLIGPFVEILKKVVSDIMIFLIIYFVSVIGFSLVFAVEAYDNMNINFSTIPNTMTYMF